MKTQILKPILVAFLTLKTFSYSVAASAALPIVTVAGIDIKGIKKDSALLPDLVIHQLRGINIYDVSNRKDGEQAAADNGFKLADCHSKSCMENLGRITGSTKILGGSIERFGDKIYLNFRILDVASGQMDKSYSMEFLALEERIGLMIEITLRKMHDLNVDEQSLKQVTSPQTLESQVNNPNISRLNLSGPRFGFGVLFGTDGKDYRRPQNQGGWGTFPVASHIGYQFEVSYLNQGNIQGLFEFIPLINGIEQGSFIPSLAILHGVRSNKSGLEFAIGTNFSITKRREGFYQDGKWISGKSPDGSERPTLHNDGHVKIEGGLVVALGKSFRSGSMNFPVNFYTVLRKDSPRIGLSLGFNTKK
ncbi:MAG: hypothetical protein IPM48_04135 [Saprospiraceae bacterium]|nr:hypothetical protein [Saprospiraceae bacterium]